jgi:hypothetical protein
MLTNQRFIPSVQEFSMKNSHATIAAVLASVVVLPSVAFAQTAQPGKLRGTINVGTEIAGSGKLHGGAATIVPSLTALNPGLPSVPALLTIEERKYSDVYDAPIAVGIEVSYGLNEAVEMYGSLSYSEAKRGNTQVGSAFVQALNATLPTFGEFGKIRNIGAEVGARYFFGSGDYQPFVGGSLGIVQQDAVKATFTIPGAPAGGITLANVPFFKKTTSFTAGVEGGLAANLSETLSGRISVGARYIGAFKGNDSVLGTLGLQSINDGTERWVYPIKASLSTTF